MRYYWYI